jgi:hypothetical protein
MVMRNRAITRLPRRVAAVSPWAMSTAPRSRPATTSEVLVRVPAFPGRTAVSGRALSRTASTERPETVTGSDGGPLKRNRCMSAGVLPSDLAMVSSPL